MESRNAYGWGSIGKSNAKINREMKKWIVGYKSRYGGIGTLGYLGLFEEYKDALEAYNKEAANASFMVEPIIRHPRALELNGGY